MQELFAGVGTRLPAAASAVGAIRRHVDRDRSRAARRLIKTLDDVKLRPLARLPKRRRLPRLSFWTDWRLALPAQLAQRTASLREAIARTPATYMPNRLHRVRIAMKKLRYTLEVARAAGVSIDRHLMRDLRKTRICWAACTIFTSRDVVDQFDAPTRRSRRKSTCSKPS
jgi:CHAD domain-containing protein